MNFFRRWIRFLFGFSRRETNGFLVLIPLIFLILFSRSLYTTIFKPKPKDFTTESVKLDSLIALLDSRDHNKPDIIQVDSLFLFDPNTALFVELKMLGFEIETANKLIRYRERGGRFVVKADVMKIYGMDSIFFKHIYPFIDLPVVKESTKSFKKAFTKNTTDSLFDLNLVDSTKLLDVFGIGTVLSSRIVRYRAKLGGFISENQLFEVYGLDSVVAKRLSDLSFINQSFKPEKINLNTFTEKQLSSHPYLSRSDAGAIVAYRFQHGPFKSIEDIRNIQSLDKKTFIKIESYLTVDH